jgi:hypothetical protein
MDDNHKEHEDHEKENLLEIFLKFCFLGSFVVFVVKE